MENIKLSNMYFSEVIDTIRSASGSNAKKEILGDALRENPDFDLFLQAVFNPHVQYGIKKIPHYTPVTKSLAPFTLRQILRQNKLSVLSERKKTGKEAQKFLENLLMNMDPADSLGLEMIIKRDIDCGVSVGHVNAVRPGLIPVYPCMLCTAYSEELALKFPLPAISQVKEDGLRANLIIKPGSVATKSRNGKPLGLDDIFSYVLTNIPVDDQKFMIDGEVRVVDENGEFLPRRISNGIINKCSKGNGSPEEKARVVFVVWDLVPVDYFEQAKTYPVGYAARLENLRKFIAKYNLSKNIRVIESRVVNSLHEAKAHFTHCIERGMEGTILKDLNGHWMHGRPKTQLKLKLENECDLYIKGFQEGTGKYVGKLGAFHMVSACGLLEVSVGSGISDDERQKYWEIRDQLEGKVGAVRYNEKIQNSAGRWSLFLPRWIELRSDKDIADSLENIK